MEYLKKISISALIFAGFAGVFGTEVKAEDKYLLESIYLKPGVGYTLPTESDVDSTVYLGARAGYEIDTNWAVELEGSWMRFGLDVPGAKELDVNSTPVLANIRYGQKCDNDQIGWYGYAGVGWSSNHLDSNELDVKLQDAPVWQVGFGAEIPVDTNLDGFLDVRYQANTSDTYAPTGVEVDNVELNAVIFTAGVKF